MATIDHLILDVNDAEASTRFYTDVLGFGYEGHDGPFTVVRVSPATTLQLAPWGTDGGQHLAFALPVADFDAAFARVNTAGLPFGDTFHDATNMCGPGDENGAQGPGKAIYLLDPNQHLIELRHYSCA